MLVQWKCLAPLADHEGPLGPLFLACQGPAGLGVAPDSPASAASIAAATGCDAVAATRCATAMRALTRHVAEQHTANGPGTACVAFFLSLFFILVLRCLL
jgi:hypothetical protein